MLDDGTATHCTMTMNTHVDDFLVSVKPASFFFEFCKYYSQFFASTYGVASEFVGLHIVRDRARRRIYIDQTLLIERILDQHYDGIMEREGLKGDDRQHVHGRSRYDQLCPVSTPFDYKNPTLDAADCLAEPDPAAVHLVQVVNGLFQYLVITRLDLIFATNQLSRIAHSPAPAHIKAMDHVLRYLAGTTGLALSLTQSASLLLRTLMIMVFMLLLIPAIRLLNWDIKVLLGTSFFIRTVQSLHALLSKIRLRFLLPSLSILPTPVLVKRLNLCDFSFVTWGLFALLCPSSVLTINLPSGLLQELLLGQNLVILTTKFTFVVILLPEVSLT